MFARRPVRKPVQAERGERRQERQERQRIDGPPSEEAAGNGTDAVGQEDEDLALGGEAR